MASPRMGPRCWPTGCLRDHRDEGAMRCCTGRDAGRGLRWCCDRNWAGSFELLLGLPLRHRCQTLKRQCLWVSSDGVWDFTQSPRLRGLLQSRTVVSGASPAPHRSCCRIPRAAREGRYIKGLANGPCRERSHRGVFETVPATAAGLISTSPGRPAGRIKLGRARGHSFSGCTVPTSPTAQNPAGRCVTTTTSQTRGVSKGDRQRTSWLPMQYAM